MLKKTLAGLFIASLALTMTACGGDDKKDTKKTEQKTEKKADEGK